MSARSFGSLFMVASCAGAALGCYLVSLRVASERASLEDVETRIVLTQRDLRVLQTEIGTRGRLSQLERWNAGAFSLSAPSANQFVGGGFELAKLAQPDRKVDFQAPVVMASAPPAIVQKPLDQDSSDGDEAAVTPASADPSALIHQASLKTETREVPVGAAATMPQATLPKSMVRPVTAAKPAILSTKDRPGLAAAKSASVKPAAKQLAMATGTAKKTVDKPIVAAAKPMTKLAHLAKNDPLAPASDKRPSQSASKPPKDHQTGR